MPPLISIRPSPRLTNNCMTPDWEVQFPFYRKDVHYFFSARYAFSAALGALSLKKGDKVLFPAYNCGIELEPLFFHGVIPVFYKVGKKLLADLEDIEAKIDPNTRGLLVIHYLGFPQPIDAIRTICRDRNLLLLEDCAHALLSNYRGQPLGSHGDASVFSLLKSLPIPDGGMLVLNRAELSLQRKTRDSNNPSSFLYLLGLFSDRTRDDLSDPWPLFSNSLNRVIDCASLATKLLLASYRRMVNPGSLCLMSPDSYLFDERLTEYCASRVTRFIIHRTDFNAIKAARRRNFSYLLHYFLNRGGIELPIRDLPPGVCPLLFPLIMPDTEGRRLVYDHLRTRGISTHPWWDRFHPQVPWEQFPEAVDLKKRILGLPVHQDLKLSHLDYMIAHFEHVYQKVWT